MPDITGIDFLKTLRQGPKRVIFTTAYQAYALEGYNLNVVDYLLKPFSFERFYQAVNKVIDKLENQIVPVNEISTTPQTVFSDSYLTIRADRKFYKINFDDINYIEGQKAYVTFHTKKKKITALASLKELEETLPQAQFIRIHKSYIVSLKELSAMEGNMVEVDDIKLPIGQTYKSDVVKIFDIK